MAFFPWLFQPIIWEIFTSGEMSSSNNRISSEAVKRISPTELNPVRSPNTHVEEIFWNVLRFLANQANPAKLSIQRGLFNTRDRAEHTRKRKTVSHTFSSKSISQFEQYMVSNLHDLIKQWNHISETATKADACGRCTNND
jgi:hypothetical protein